MNITKFLILILLFVGSRKGHGKEFFEYGQSIRALGMGNAYTAVVNNGDALYYNPAALGRVKGINVTILNLNAGVNGQNAYQSGLQIANSTATGIDRFSNFFGQQLWIGSGGKINITTPNFGFGVYDSGFVGFELKDPILPYFDINILNDYGVIVAGSIPVGPSSYLGVSAKRITRMGSNEQIGVSSFLDGTTANLQSNINRRGTGYGADLGFVWEIPGPLNPVLSGVWKDVGTTNFLKQDGVEKPPRLIDERILGVAAGFDFAVFGMLAAIDYKHINTLGENVGKKVHMGLEFNLPLIDIRAGFSQGYYSLGASLDLFLFQVDLAYYGVELGEYPGQDEDRRIQVAFTMEMGFDPSLRFLDFNKTKGRRLKQRR